MASVTLEVPDFQYILSHNSGIVVGIVVLLIAALAGSVGFEIWKRRKEAKAVEKLAKATVARALAGFETLTVSASYLLLVIQDNKQFIDHLPWPWLSVFIPAAVGFATTVYNLGLNKTYQAVANVLKGWSTKKPAGAAFNPASTTVPVSETTQPDLLS